MPDRKKVLWYTNSWRGSAVSYFDGSAKTWQHILGKKRVKGNPNCPGTEAIAAYDANKGVLVAQYGGGTHRGKPRPKGTYLFDANAKKWQRALHGHEGPIGLDMRASMTYDSVAKRHFIVDGSLWSYAFGDEAWTKLTPRVRRRRTACCATPPNTTC
jgi:hypothetical protein